MKKKSPDTCQTRCYSWETKSEIMVAVPCKYRRPGLVIHGRLLDADKALISKTTFEITHERSGLVIMQWIPTLRQAKTICNTLADTFDWTKTAKQIQKNTKMRDFVADIARGTK